MKLSDHVDKIRVLTHKSFFNYFARLGVTAKKIMEIEKLPEGLKAKREKVGLVIKSHLQETKSFAAAYEKTLDEYTFTLFNRIAAVKVMEAHRLFPEVITKRPENGNRSFSHRAWLENNKNMAGEELEGIRQFIIFEFNRLGEEIPLYHKNYPYALLPNVIELNEIIDAFNAVEKDPDIDDAIWQSDDILGWLYESYNNIRKLEHKDSKKKTEYDKVSLQSQVYTPRWVVKFLVDNSLGRLYLEMYPDSKIKNKYKIVNSPGKRVRGTKSLHKITIIDPAVGSGNFLFYTFDLLYDLYMDQIDNYGADYDEDGIPKLIIENNLHGIDIDNRAVQIAQLGLYIKAMRKKRDIHIEKFNVVSSDFVLPDYEDVEHIFKHEDLDRETTKLLRETWGDLKMAFKFGSLVRIEEKVEWKINEIKEVAKKTSFGLKGMLKKWENWKETVIPQVFKAVDVSSIKNGDTFLGEKTKEALTYLSILYSKYDVAVCNPPYTDTRNFGPQLKTFIDTNYKGKYRFNSNLYACFFKRCAELLDNYGFIGMIHPLTFMYIKTFEDLRRYILNKFSISILVEFGMGGLFPGHIFVDPAFYVLKKEFKINNESIFISLDQYSNTNLQKNKKIFLEQAILDLLDNQKNKHLYKCKQDKLKIIKSWPFIYWISDGLRKQFEMEDLESVSDVCQGMSTSHNHRFLRFWWEVSKYEISGKIGDNLKWVKYSKGGPYKKWFGNFWLLIEWENNGKNVKNFASKLYGSASRTIKNQNFYFKEGVTYSASGSKGVSFRFLPKNMIFDIGGSCIFLNKKSINNSYLLAFLNSKLASYIANCLNPTVNIQVGDLKRVPFVTPPSEIEEQIVKLSEKNIEIQKHICSFSIIEHNYLTSPFMFINNSSSNLINKVKNFFNYENYIFTLMLINEAIINEKIFEIYNLSQDDKKMVLIKDGDSVGNLPVIKEAKQAYLNEKNIPDEFSLNEVKNFINKLPETEFPTEIQNRILVNLSSLYQKNNNLEDFCKRYQVNPINIWFWFKKNNDIPKHRVCDVTMEFLADLIREILMEDEDGIVPLVRSTGEEILIDRIEKKFMEKKFSSAQFAQIDKLLGREINEFFDNHFFNYFSNHLNLFRELPMTPFIWHITSGPNHGFDAYIIIYKWNRDRLFSLKSVYIEKRETALKNRQSDLQNDNSAKAQNEKDLISKQLKEIENLKIKIDELLAEGYNPVLDDGVGKNIAPLQKKGIIAYDVLNKGQLEKYLNADW